MNKILNICFHITNYYRAHALQELGDTRFHQLHEHVDWAIKRIIARNVALARIEAHHDDVQALIDAQSALHHAREQYFDLIEHFGREAAWAPARRLPRRPQRQPTLQGV